MQVLHEPLHNSATVARFVAVTDEPRAGCPLGGRTSVLVQIVPERIVPYPQTLTSSPGPAPPTSAQRETGADMVSGPALGHDAIENLLRLTLHLEAPIPTPWMQTTHAA